MKKPGLRIGIIESFLVVMTLLFVIILTGDYFWRLSLERRAAQRLFMQAAKNVKKELSTISAAAQSILVTTKASQEASPISFTEPGHVNALFMPRMKVYPFITSINYGDSNGNGYLILRTGDEWKNRLKRAAEKDQVIWRTLNVNGKILAQERRKDDYDPRKRPWYQNAIREQGIAWSAPYLFQTTGDAGITASLRISGGAKRAGVIGADIMLRDISESLAALAKDNPGLAAYLVTPEGLVIASSDRAFLKKFLSPGSLSLPSISAAGYPALITAIKTNDQDKSPAFFSHEGEKFLYIAERFHFSPAQDLFLLVMIPETALIADFLGETLWKLMVFFVVLFTGGAWFARRYLFPLKKLSRAMRDLGGAELVPLTVDTTRNDEIGDIAAEFVQMEGRIVRQQNKIAKSSQLWRGTLDSLDELVSVVDLEYRILKVNRPLADLYGLHPRDMIGRKCYEVVHRTEAPPPYCPHQQTIAEGRPAQAEILMPDSGKYFEVFIAPMFTDDGKVASCVHVMRDITLRKQADVLLRASEEKYRRISREFNALLDAISDNITLLDHDLKIVWANDSVAKELGLTADEVVGRHCHDLWFQRDFPCPVETCLVARSLSTGLGERGVKVDAAGRTRDLRTYPILDVDQKVINVIEIGRDITEHRQLEEQLRQSQKMEAVGQLTGGIAHDFNNILTAIMGYGHLLQIKLGNSPLKGDVEEILKATNRAATLTRSLLAFSRKQQLQLAPTTLNRIYRETEKLLVRLLGADIEIEALLSDVEMTLHVDAGQIGQVLINLAANARDALPAGGRLTIETGLAEYDGAGLDGQGPGKPGRYALLIMSDNGVGMDEDTRTKIFEPFYTTKGVGRGTGLGLSIVYGIVKQHNGFITCDSEPGRGTAFRIYLPLAEGTMGLPATETDRNMREPKGGRETILIAEDDQSLRELARTVLGEFGYLVIESRDGQEALEKFQEHQDSVQLLILDVVMPRLNGKEAYDAIRQIRPGIRTIFLSGYTANILRKKGIAEEDVDLMMKPVSPRELLRKVREILDR
ncbi:MAG: PAS domain-containing protein [Smithellaceae bacterium]|nr:PAS domain-containing protein [Smithellaceae bacterium]